jgi:hypothetical protein
MDRPVLLPHHGAGIDLKNDFGGPWVHTYEGELVPEILSNALQQAAQLPERTDGLHVSSIDVARVAQKLVDVFRELVRI